VAATSAIAQTTTDAGPVVSPQARAIHESALVVDTHADTPQFMDDRFDLRRATGYEAHFDLEKARAGNVGAEFFSIWVEPQRYQGRYAHRTLQLIDAVYQQVMKNPDGVVMVFSTADILAARKQKKLAALLGIEGGHSIENNLALLRDFYRLGVRYMTLAWANTNEWADSSGDMNDEKVKHHNGLTDFGKEVVREMNRLGMMVDISHVSDKAFYDTIAVTQAPVIASHSSARALTNHARNMTDDMLRAVAKNGGVVMVNFYPAFIDEEFRKASAATAKERNAAVAAHAEKFKDADDVTYYRERDQMEKQWAAKIPRPPFKSLIDHIDHIAKVAGVDHVGLGSDFDGVSSLPQGIDSAADLPKITQALLDRGYTREQVHKILGGNLMRVFREVEAVARRAGTERTP
jgi:membrane dipeptidase